MRRFVLVSLTVLSFIGLSQLADRFREETGQSKLFSGGAEVANPAKNAAKPATGKPASPPAKESVKPLQAAASITQEKTAKAAASLGNSEDADESYLPPWMNKQGKDSQDAVAAKPSGRTAIMAIRKKSASAQPKTAAAKPRTARSRAASLRDHKTRRYAHARHRRHRFEYYGPYYGPSPVYVRGFPVFWP